ncbi:MAG: class I SAM-dependent methyltransferase [Vicingaceae bacterium]
MVNFWDERFSRSEYVYGRSPNAFLKKCLDALPAGSILFPGEGEGRNAVYAAQLGWEVTAFDSSVMAMEKANRLAAERSVEIDYSISDYLNFNSNDRFDAVALLFTHLPGHDRESIHRKYVTLLKPGGRLILQAFRKEQLGLNSGGPKDLDMLFSVDELTSDFDGLSELVIKETNTSLSEGSFHLGMARLINVLGVK